MKKLMMLCVCLGMTAAGYAMPPQRSQEVSMINSQESTSETE